MIVQPKDSDVSNSYIFVSSSNTTSDKCTANQRLVFSGTFEDPSYGGNISICPADESSTINAAYSNLGIIRGGYDAVSRTWRGKWFEPGTHYARGAKTNGDVWFTVPIGSDFNSFVGYYTYSGDSEINGSNYQHFV